MSNSMGLGGGGGGVVDGAKSDGIGGGGVGGVEGGEGGEGAAEWLSIGTDSEKYSLQCLLIVNMLDR